MTSIQDSAKRMSIAFEQVLKNKINLGKNSLANSLLNFKARKSEYIKKTFVSSLKDFRDELENLDPSQEAMKLKSLVCGIKGNDLMKIREIIEEIRIISAKIKSPEKIMKLKPKSLPDAIKSEVEADIKELETCFNHGLYRSAVILCGRILETALHRKYFETVGIDLLEKSPGIGLGKIISKLSEKNIELDPGLTQQIHLINQLRIFTVHKKQKAFYPSKAQAHAIILYSLDVLDKLF